MESGQRRLMTLSGKPLNVPNVVVYGGLAQAFYRESKLEPALKCCEPPYLHNGRMEVG